MQTIVLGHFNPWGSKFWNELGVKDLESLSYMTNHRGSVNLNLFSSKMSILPTLVGTQLVFNKYLLRTMNEYHL